MPVSPALAEDLAAAIGELYASAELSLIQVLRDALAQDIESPLWAELKLAAVGDLRRAVETVTEALQDDADGAIAQALATAYDRGAQAAIADMGALPEGQRAFAARQLPNAPAVDRLARSMAEDTRPLYVRITRAIVDTYRRVIARAAGAQILTGRTRRQASQEALDQFAARGITGFVDRAGRSWNLASYAEMAVRSVTARAVVEGHTDQLQAAGIDLVIVSDAPLNCPLCEPWEGEVLTLSGPDSPHTVRARHAVTDRPRAVHVAGSLRVARAEGLFHPNCRHSLSAYLPGVSTRPESHPHPQGATYEDTQKQRYLERQVRRWKRRQAAAMDDAARRRAGARVRAYQARIRELTAEKDLKRKPEREQIPSARPPRGEAADRTGPRDPDEPPAGIDDTPSGTPVHSGSITDKITGIDPATPHGAAMQRTLAAINRVHRVPDWMRSIPLEEVEPGRRKTKKGSYLGAYRGIRIELNPEGRYLHITAAHEMGHFFDHAVLGAVYGPEGRGFGTESQLEGGVLSLWWRAVSRTPTARLFSLMKRTFGDGAPMVDYQREDGSKWTLKAEHRHIDYLASPLEMFGRAYAQWIALRSGDPTLFEDLERARDVAQGRQVALARGGVRGYPAYWSDREFAPIAAAMDDLFRQLGLLGGSDG